MVYGWPLCPSEQGLVEEVQAPSERKFTIFSLWTGQEAGHLLRSQPRTRPGLRMVDRTGRGWVRSCRGRDQYNNRYHVREGAVCAWWGLSHKPYTPMSLPQPVSSYCTDEKTEARRAPQLHHSQPYVTGSWCTCDVSCLQRVLGSGPWGAICLPSCHLLLGPRAVRSRPHTKPGPQASRATPSPQLQSCPSTGHC